MLFATPFGHMSIGLAVCNYPYITCRKLYEAGVSLCNKLCKIELETLCGYHVCSSPFDYANICLFAPHIEFD